ncbi:hypothetical protein KSS87_003689 [Heliosperma pusillum]|nr:hypothetical protein KSS87_003689 [Heliosperma pusillum]
MWPGLVQLAKEGGVNAIESYVFWNGHELSPDNFYFEGRFDLVKFVKTVQQAGMYMILRIGPFVAAEWNYGGVPVWLHYVPGTVFRTDNEPWKYYMQKFTTYIVNLLKQEKLFASQGGPIILAQIENEYGNYEPSYGDGGKRYAQWCAKMALSQNIGVPWIMCQQWDTPDPVYHGGTNFGRTAGDYVTTSYDYDAPIDEYGLARFPKWGHLKELHEAIKLCEKTLVNGERTNLSLGPSLEADVYTETSGACVAFLSNSDNKTDRIVQFRNMTYNLPAWSVSILPDCKNVEFNSATVGSQSFVVDMVSEELQQSASSSNGDLKTLQWEVCVEKPGIWGEPDFNITGFVDHINTTKDTTDYLWVTTRLFLLTQNQLHTPFFKIIAAHNKVITVFSCSNFILNLNCSLYLDSNEILENNISAVLSLKSKGHALHVFVNQELQGSPSGTDLTAEIPISLKAGRNEIALLSMTVGLTSAGTLYEWVGAGVTSAEVKGLKNGTLDLADFTWFYKIGLQGEHLNLYKGDGLKSSNWISTAEPPKQKPLTWYKLMFCHLLVLGKVLVDAPSNNEPIGLDMIHMWKGLAWLNGEQIGRYHIPRSWFKPSGNVLVIFEERGGDPTQIRFSKRKVSSICCVVSDDHLSISAQSWTSAVKEPNDIKPAARLGCPDSTRISSIKFASFGDPSGACGSYTRGDCHDPNSVSVVEKICLNKSVCDIKLTDENFNQAFCPNTVRRLAVEAVCG